MFPYFAVPAYWVFGNSKFDRYLEMRREHLDSLNPFIAEFRTAAEAQDFAVPLKGSDNTLMRKLFRVPATRGNAVELLIDDNAFFPSIIEGIESAESYLLVQFYIVRDDKIGERFTKALLDAKARGVRVHFLIDEVGSYDLPDAYLDELRTGGVEIYSFNQRSGLTNRFRLNFRNHRKVVIADGRHAWVGEANFGDEYNGEHETLTPWRETMVKVTGPVVQTIQFPFLEDWLRATGDEILLDWDHVAAPSGGDLHVLTVTTGPADPFET